METCKKNMKIFAGNSSIILAKDIVEQLKMKSGIEVKLGDSEIKRFADGEIDISIRDTVRGADVFLIQSTSAPVNENMMELLLMLDALKRASAGRITAVIPYFGYARQDRKAKAHDPISAKLVADIITKAGADRVLTMDLHTLQIQGFFDIPLDHLMGVNILVDYYLKRFKDINDEIVIVSPDIGSAGRARLFAQKINMELAMIDKRRIKVNECEVCNIIGDVAGKICILVDDIIDTGGTICKSAEALLERGGAKEVYACATHAVLSKNACDKLHDSVIKDIVFLDTIAIPQNKMIDKFIIWPTAKMFAEAIYRIFNDLPLSPCST